MPRSSLFSRKPKHVPEIENPPAGSSTCQVCGVATDAPPDPDRRDSEGHRMPMLNPPTLWPTCPACTSVIKRYGDAGARAVLLGQLLGEPLAADDPAAVRAAARLPLARDVPKLAQPAKITVPYAPRAIGDEPVPVEDRTSPTQPSGPGSPTRWQHVSGERRDELRAALIKESKRERRRRHVNGPCAYCGQRRAMRWHGPLQVLSGFGQPRWMACDRCFALTQKAGTTLADELGEWLTGEALNVAPSMGRSYVRAYCLTRVTGTDPAKDAGTTERFEGITFKHKLEAARRWPKYAAVAPEDVRQRLELEQRIAAANQAMDEARKPTTSAVTFDTDQNQPTIRSY